MVGWPLQKLEESTNVYGQLKVVEKLVEIFLVGNGSKGSKGHIPNDGGYGMD